MKRTTEIVVDDRTYSVSQYSATKGLKLLPKIVKVIGKPLSVLSGAGLDAEVTGELLSGAIGDLADALDEGAFERMTKEILETTRMMSPESRELVFDVDFMGRYWHLIKLLKEVISFQYNDFLAGITGLQLDLVAKPKVMSRVAAR